MKSRAFGACAGSPPTGSDRPVALSTTLADVTNAAWINLLQLSTPKCAFRPKYHWLPFARLGRILVEEGAVVSTIVPVGDLQPLGFEMPLRLGVLIGHPTQRDLTPPLDPSRLDHTRRMDDR